MIRMLLLCICLSDPRLNRKKIFDAKPGSGAPEATPGAATALGHRPKSPLPLKKRASLPGKRRCDGMRGEDDVVFVACRCGAVQDRHSMHPLRLFPPGLGQLGNVMCSVAERHERGPALGGHRPLQPETKIARAAWHGQKRKRTGRLLTAPTSDSLCANGRTRRGELRTVLAPPWLVRSRSLQVAPAVDKSRDPKIRFKTEGNCRKADPRKCQDKSRLRAPLALVVRFSPSPQQRTRIPAPERAACLSIRAARARLSCPLEMTMLRRPSKHHAA